ncbi:glutaredoxin family protein [Microbacterium sp. NPDC078428]|uniref:glutaredoxin family protein n=1 Tax=Microbacterium sp. NPDC078428 TaxID=3364190 RepID=UPI0037C98841
MTEEPKIIVWTKPACVQCRLVKNRLAAAGVPFVEADLTAPESAADLEHFRGLGYQSAPITEYGGTAFPGFMPAEVDRVIAEWRAAHPVTEPEVRA